MTTDPYIQSLKNEIADLKTQNEMLRNKLLIRQDQIIRMAGKLGELMVQVCDMQ